MNEIPTVNYVFGFKLSNDINCTTKTEVEIEYGGLKTGSSHIWICFVYRHDTNLSPARASCPRAGPGRAGPGRAGPGRAWNT